MEFTSPLVKGRLLKRYKRFLADVELEDGTHITAHCPNTGAMTHCIEDDMQVLLRHDPNPKRKLHYTWEFSVTQQGDWIGINTHNANKLVEECLLDSSLLLDIGAHSLKREFNIADSNSRFDFALIDQMQNLRHVIEVKSVTLLENGQGFFPDTVTERGAKHCLELAKLAQQGIPCTLIFCVQHSGISSVRCAQHIDKRYAEALMNAKKAKVNIIAGGCKFENQKLYINQQLPFEM